MGATKLSLSPLKGHDGNTAKKQHARLVEAQINNDTAPHCKTACGGDKCAAVAKTTIRPPKEGTTIGTWNIHSLHASRKVEVLTHGLKCYQ